MGSRVDAGGGSGGEAAVISAGGSALGLATDIAGSIRVPGHSCAVAGLKPTTFRLTTLGAPREFFLPGLFEIVLDPGVFSRSVADLDLALGVLSAPGQSALDPRIPPVDWPDYGRVAVDGLRIGLFDDDGFFACSPAIRRVVHEAAAALRDQGAEVEPFPMQDGAIANDFFVKFVCADGLEWIRRLERRNPIDHRTMFLKRVVRLPNVAKPTLAKILKQVGQHGFGASIAESRTLSVREYLDVVTARDEWRADFMRRWDSHRFDALICPPYPLPALRHGATKFVFTPGSYSVVFNLVGVPTGILPASRVRPGEESDRPATRDIVESTARETERGSAGLPVGVQVVARHWREDVVLAVMAALEEHFRAQPDYPAEPPI